MGAPGATTEQLSPCRFASESSVLMIKIGSSSSSSPSSVAGRRDRLALFVVLLRLGIADRRDRRVGVALIADAVVVGVGLIGVGDHRAVVQRVLDAVSVIVGVALVADTVIVRVDLRGVGLLGAVVAHVEVTIVVVVAVTGVAVEIVIEVGLIGVGDRDAVVDVIVDAVAVGVRIARITDAVVVHVFLTRVCTSGQLSSLSSIASRSLSW